ncbi:C40 family peptidase [Streptomyces sp. NPDC050659]|uniref:C40 family peptidase n=2 Tax=unclassified Streptomyces TaxID=2593676 RepID=UPI0034267330
MWAVAGMVLAIATALPGTADAAQAITPGEKALRIAASKRGAPYQWGAAGPYRFDCSGLTLYAFKKVGKKLPRTAAAQYNRSWHVPAKARRAGDLVFFHSGNRIYHVGIYAGRKRVWHSPKPGRSVRLEKLWTNRVWYGRY